MSILFMIIYIVLLVLIGLAVISLCTKTIFEKVRINKWIPLIGAIGLLILQIVVKLPNMIANGLVSILCVTLFVWYRHLHMTGGPRAKEKPIVIKPKAKPNRVKHMQKDNE